MGSASSPRRVRVERGIYLQPNGKYAVCCRRAGRLRFRTVGPDRGEARPERAAFIAAVQRGVVPVLPRLRFDTVACWWLQRFEAKVAAAERRPRTLEAHRYQLDRHLVPAFAARRVASITVDDVADLLLALQGKGCSAKTSAGALATLQSIMRFARRHGWIGADPVDQLEPHERPRPARRHQRVLGRDDIERLLAACPSRDRLMVATVLYTGLRISELLGLIWDDIDFAAGVIHVRAQLSPSTPRRTGPTRAAQDQRLDPRHPARRAARPATRRAQAGDPIQRAQRLGVRDRQRHPARSSQRDPARPPTRRPDRRSGQQRLPPAALPRPPPHLRQPLDPRSTARRGSGQPHPRACAHHDHPRRLHPPLRQRPPRPRDPRAHDGKPIRRTARHHDRRAQRDSASAPLPEANVVRSRSAAGSATNRPDPLGIRTKATAILLVRAWTASGGNAGFPCDLNGSLHHPRCLASSHLIPSAVERRP
jgi:hypothetical protein